MPFSFAERVIFVPQCIVMQGILDVTAIEGSCLSCGKPLRGRVDKKFCDGGCRNVLHNWRQRVERRQISGVDLVLKHKRRILKACIGRERAQLVGKEELLAGGYRFEYFTHHFTNCHGKRCCFCYDHGWLDLGGGQCLVLKQTVAAG